MSAAARRAWAGTELRVWPGRYAFASFAPREAARVHAAAAAAAARRAFVAVIAERHEVSLTAPWRLLRLGGLGVHANAVAGPFKVVTFDVALDLALVGYLAPAAVRLMQAGVSIVPQCGYRTDHLLLREPDLERAVAVLEAWIASCRGGRQPGSQPTASTKKGRDASGATPRGEGRA